MERRGGADLRGYLKQHSRYFILITMVVGAITGVGIWFTIGLVSPAATSILIRNFVWGWAIEWVFFIIEVTAALLYYYTWDRVDSRTHQLFGWSYAVAAWLTLAMINGIVSFMLTPGRWLTTGSFWHGVFNPSYLPSLLLRTLASLVMAGLYALVTGNLQRDPVVKEKVGRAAARWLFPGLVPMPLGAVWYLDTVPAGARLMVAGGAPAASIIFVLAIGSAALLVLLAYLGPWRQPLGVSAALVVTFLLLGFVATGAAVDAGVWPRLLTALGLAGLSGSLYALWVAGRHPDLPETGLTRRTAAWWAVAAGLLALAGGGWYSLTLPGPVPAALGAGPARWLGWLAAAGILAAVASVLAAAGRIGHGLTVGPAFWLGTAALVLSLGTGSVARLLVRQAYLAPHLQAAAWQVQPQWDVFGVFALVLVLGIAFVVYLLTRLRSADTRAV
ncbi:MAG: cytochrome ubiquinol oxidase subunit I [Firmicutes bacterium]|nr:cytochrome ubiquinol oxidase subunit I [Bacillota bacterium]